MTVEYFHEESFSIYRQIIFELDRSTKLILKM